MSQINDALRRAGHSAKAGSGGPPMPPPMPAHPPSSAPPPPAPPPVLTAPALPPMPNFGELEGGENAPRKSTGIQIGLAILLVVCVSVAAVVTFWEKRNRASTNAKPTAEAGSKKMLSEEALNKTVAARQPAPVTPTNPGAPNVPKAATPAPVVAAAPAPPPRPVEPVKFPPLRLQSIFFRPSSPSVMINNKTLFVDDMIQGVQVADIQPSSVTLVLSGQTNILTLR